ncbi:Arm DNA-binding domain-containing protein [Ellagibacter isourolithinifaciens]|uniref:Arm DNA-binding domain-containing protein n=1 Tax=Ellagibacter isourolithinifaciens TaxID=2137581 RepID=UPI003A93D35E
MPVYKDDNNGTFYVQCYYRDARGSKRHKTKRGFSSEVEAAVWEGQFKSLNGGAMDMTFSEFVEVYASEVKPRIREHTWITKEYIINDKLVPFFGDMRMCDVRPIDVIRWHPFVAILVALGRGASGCVCHGSSNLPVRHRARTPHDTVCLFVCATIEPPDGDK